MNNSESRIPGQFAEYRASLDEGDLPAAVEASVQMEEASPAVASLLADFRRALNEGDTELARMLLLQLNNAYDERTTEEQARVQRAVTAIERGDLTSSERKELFDLTKTMAHTKLARSNFLSVAISYLESDSDRSSTEVTDTATTTQDAEASLSTSEESVDTVSESVELDGTPTILDTAAPSTVATNELASVSVIIGNVGDAETGDLSIRASSSSGVTPIEETSSVGVLTADEQLETVVEFEISAQEDVELSITLREDGTEIESTSETLTIRSQAVSVREAITGEADAALNATDIQQAISFWANDETVPKTGGKTVTTDQLQQFITERLESGGDDP